VESLNPVEQGRARMAPVIVVHGEREDRTPVTDVRRFCDRVEAGGGRCVLHVYPGVGISSRGISPVRKVTLTRTQALERTVTRRNWNLCVAYGSNESRSDR
jgi:acetyl esterase/lipase